MKPLLSDKVINHEKILLTEEGETISDDKKIPEKLNNIFADAVKNLNIPYENPSVYTDHIEDPIIYFIEIFKNHQSIKLKVVFFKISPFSFDEIRISETEKNK